MNKFNLERALAGDKVVTRDGREVTQLTNFNVDAMYMRLTGVVGRELRYWHIDGINPTTTTDDSKLFMAPKKLSGFINLYHDRESTFHTARFNGNGCHTIIDLSQFDEGHGL